MTKSELDNIFENFNQLTALIIGDVMIDSYMWGSISRTSPEAPVPIVAVSKKENRLGGAANVALNIQALGATPVLCSIIGDDHAGDNVINLMSENDLITDGIIQSSDRPTTVKTRVIANEKHALRVDEEIEDDINSALEERVWKRFLSLLDNENIDVVVFEDYNKGLLTENLIQKIIAKCEELGIPSISDPKKKNFLAFKNISLFKPNLKEIVEGLDLSIDPKDHASLQLAFKTLNDKLHYKKALVTLSENGAAISSEDGFYVQPAFKRNIKDVSGAGDTVLSVASLCLALNTDDKTLTGLSNLAGGLVCEKVGVVPIDKNELRTEAEKLL